MKKILIFAIAILGYITLTATDVSGNQSGTWLLSESPYNLVGDIVIPTNETLNIEPGVEVISMGYYQIEINGEMIALGTSEEMISFSGENFSDWGGISIDTDGSLDESIFTYCSIQNTNDTNDYGIHAINSRVSIDNCQIFDHQTAVSFSGLSSDNPVPMSISNSYIYDCQKSGIIVVDQSFADISDNQISQCGLGENFYGAIQLSLQSDSHSCSPTITGNHIHHNGKQGITLANLFGYQNMAPTVTDNLIEYNLTGIYLYAGKGIYTNNIIRHNFIENDANSGAGVMLYGANADAVFSHNQIYGNFSAIYLANGATANLGNLNNDTTDDDGYNLIYDNVFYDGTPYSIVNNSSADVMAQNNIWQNDNSENIAELIIDSNDSGSYGTVIYEPFLTILAPVAEIIIENINPLQLSWEIGYNTHANFVGYNIYRNNVMIAQDVTETTYTFDSLPTEPITLGISVVYDEGESGICEYYYVPEILNPPTNVVYSFTSSSAVLEWNEPEAGSTLDLESYFIYFQDEILETAETNYELIDLEIGETYLVAICANYGEDNLSEQIEIEFTFNPTSTDENLTLANLNLTNYPNPFNPSAAGRCPTTTIKFNLCSDNHKKTEILIYNFKGQKVKTLLNSKLNSGTHNIIWNGTDDSYSSVSSGVYFYQLIIDGEKIASKKCLLMK